MKSQNFELLRMSRMLRLNYYNDYLYKNGMISEREYKKMNSAILKKYQRNNHSNTRDLFK
jgi:hypothetical protein